MTDAMIYLGLLVVESVLSIGIVSWFSWTLFKRRKQNFGLKKQIQSNLEEYLELSTTEQLLGELRKRPTRPYIMLTPLHGEHHAGISIEVHGVAPTTALSVLQMATMVTAKEMKDRGVEMPEDFLPDFPSDMFNRDDSDN